MKKFFKFGCLGFIALVILFIGIALAGVGSGSSNKATQSNQSTQVSTPAPTTPQATQQPKQESQPKQPAPPVNKPTMSKAEFDKIQTGMTYEQVVEIVGGNGEVQSESGTKGDPYYTVMYSFEGEGALGANASLLFQGGKLNTKSQFGLQ